MPHQVRAVGDDMPVADLPIAVVVASSEQQSDIIEVVASRAGEALKIDRRTYQSPIQKFLRRSNTLRFCG